MSRQVSYNVSSMTLADSQVSIWLMHHYYKNELIRSLCNVVLLVPFVVYNFKAVVGYSQFFLLATTVLSTFIGISVKIPQLQENLHHIILYKIIWEKTKVPNQYLCRFVAYKYYILLMKYCKIWKRLGVKTRDVEVGLLVFYSIQSAIIIEKSYTIIITIIF